MSSNPNSTGLKKPTANAAVAALLGTKPTKTSVPQPRPKPSQASPAQQGGAGVRIPISSKQKFAVPRPGGQQQGGGAQPVKGGAPQFPSRGGSASSARTPIGRGGPAPLRPPVKPAPAPREPSPEPLQEPEPEQEPVDATEHYSPPLSNQQQDEGWVDNSGSYQDEQQVGEYQGEQYEEGVQEYNYAEAEAGEGEGVEQWMGGVRKHGLAAIDHDEPAVQAKRAKYNDYSPQEHEYEPQSISPTLANVDDDRHPNLHDSSPPPEEYNQPEDDYSAYDHTDDHASNSGPPSHQAYAKPSLTPIGHSYYQPQAEPASQLHSLVSIADLNPGDARPHVRRAGDRAQQMQAEGGNKWESCSEDEWKAGGQELVEKMAELMRRIIQIGLKKMGQAQEFGTQLRTRMDDTNEYIQNVTAKGEEIKHATDFSS